MSQPRIVLCTLVLNELEWLPKLYIQHKDWPGLVEWVFVEAADQVFAERNPSMVQAGLSVDGTTEFLEALSRDDKRITHVKHGISSHCSLSQGKCTARNQYLRIADVVKPDWLYVVDADEFYPLAHQASICRIMERLSSKPEITGAVFRQRHIWRPPSVVAKPLFHAEVTGGYWGVPHARAWRWRKEMTYETNHNIPEGFKGPYRFDVHPDNPYCIHMGFASMIQGRRAKHAYYIARGEDRNLTHRMYVDCRRAFEEWRPGIKLPHGAEVLPWYGDTPEVFV